MYCNSEHSRLGLTAATLAIQALAAIAVGVSRLDPDTYLGVTAAGMLSMGVRRKSIWPTPRQPSARTTRPTGRIRRRASF
jgi:hypothetical protein